MSTLNSGRPTIPAYAIARRRHVRIALARRSDPVYRREDPARTALSFAYLIHESGSNEQVMVPESVAQQVLMACLTKQDPTALIRSYVRHRTGRANPMYIKQNCGEK